MIDRCYIEITNVCNLNCDFCPKHHRASRQMTLDEFDLLTDRIRGEVCFLYFHLMGEPLLHPLLPQFIAMARSKGFKTVLTSNGTLLHRTTALLDTLPHKIQLSLHSHEANAQGRLVEYVDEVMQFATQAAQRGTCVVLRLWNQGGRNCENEELMRLMATYVPQPWHQRPDGYRLCDNLYLEFDRKFAWPQVASSSAEYCEQPQSPQLFCKALVKQIGVLVDGSLVPCCLDHEGDVVLGNLYVQSLHDILHSPRARALVDGFFHHKAAEKLCQNCESALAKNSFRGKARS